MITLEEKIDIILKYIAADDEEQKVYLKEAAKYAISEEPTNNDAAVINDIIIELLKEIGVPANVRGYEFLIESIKLAVNDPYVIRYITKEIYHVIADKCQSTHTRVERGIRHAIEIVWTSRDLEYAHYLFGNTIDINKSKPTNSEFIAACANEIRRRMRKMK